MHFFLNEDRHTHNIAVLMEEDVYALMQEVKGLSGSEAAKIFEKYDIYRYITKYFESLHTMGDHCIVQDIDDYIANRIKQHA